MKSYIGMIPARLESSRFPRKLLVKLGGKSVLQRTYESAIQNPSLEKVFIVTDSQEILAEAAFFGAPTIQTSNAPSSGTERIAEAVVQNPFLQKFSYFINLQGDHPFTSTDTIQKLIDTLEENPEVEVATCIKPLLDKAYVTSPQVVKCVFDANHNALYFSRSPIPYFQKNSTKKKYFQHIGIYGYSKAFLLNYPQYSFSFLEEAEQLEQLRFLEQGIQIKVALVNDIGQGVDTPEDIPRCEQILCQTNV